MTHRTRCNLGSISVLLLGLSCAATQAALLNQILTPSDYDASASVEPNVSQIFTDFPNFSSLALDDFEISGADLNVRQVQVLVIAQAGFDSFGSISNYHLNFFDDPSLAGSSLVGNIVSDSISSDNFFVNQVGNSDLALVTLIGEWALPAEGTYWVGVAPEASFSVAGQFSVANGGASGVDGGSNGFFANPANGFGGGTLEVVPTDFAYFVSPEVVPEPTVGVLFLCAALTGIGRRRRV